MTTAGRQPRRRNTGRFQAPDQPLDSYEQARKTPMGQKSLRIPRPKLTSDPNWNITVEGVDPLREPEFESWFTVSNGVSGTRGSVEEGSDASDPATFIAGTYVESERGSNLATGPNWTELAILVGNDLTPVTLHTGEVHAHKRVLNLRNGILLRTWLQKLPSGALMSYRSGRFASMAEPQLMVLWAEVKAGLMEAEIGEGGEVKEHTEIITRSGPIEFAAWTRNGAGRTLRIAAVRRPGANSERSVDQVLQSADHQGVSMLFASHAAAWEKRWRRAEVVIEGDPDAQKALNFALYHLVSAGESSGCASIGARGLTGRGYHGHVFWDTEVFMLPFFIATHPPTARGLLDYRHRLLPAARAKAASLGYKGALFPWESADNGEERTPRWIAVAPSKQVPLLGGLQGQHISADVAWAAWQYWRWTGDDDFFTVCGADLLIETARFWAARARRRHDGRLHIARVIGPDEYHQTVDDNAFTNVLARWNLEQAANTVEYLSEIKASKDSLFNLGVTHAEVRRWRRAASGLVDGFDPSTGLYEQFTGFFHLEEILAAGLAERPFPADLFLGSKRTARSQVIKQADVLMIPHMLPEVVPLDVTAANYRYYEPRTSHGSSLSPAIHALIAARIGAVDEALAYFHMAAAIDLNDEMGNAAQGIHMASLGGLWQAAVAGFGGTRVHDDALRIDPHLPERWTRLSFPVLFRGIEIHVDATANSLTVTVGDRVKIAIGDGPAIAVATGRHSARLVNGVWSRLEQVVSG